MSLQITQPNAISIGSLPQQYKARPDLNSYDALSVYHKRAEVFGQGEPSGPLYSVAFGCVRIGRVTLDGKRQICGFCLPGDVFGWESEGEHRFFAEAACETGIRVLRPNRERDASLKLLPMALESLARFQEHLIVLGKNRVDERFAAFLVDLNERIGVGNRILLPMPRSDVADFLGVSIETVSRVLRRFIDTGILIVPDTHSIIVRDARRLAELAAH
jgi:CRP/FNR family nitrogen fixation transcriptional regulator